MAGENELLANITATGNSNPVTVDDVSNYNFGLSPDEEQLYNQSQEQFRPVSQPLGVHDYYPNQGDPIGVGQSSGRIIGSQTQYVPNGGLVPIGMWDARDAAIQKAAMAKAKDVADWKAKNAKAPTSKLTNINENITKEFFNHQESAWKQAMKASGGDANKAKFLLENNQDYQAKNKSFYDSAKMGDAVVEQDIQLANDIKSGKMVETPAMAEARQKLHLSLNPENPEFKDLANRYTAFQAVKEYNDAYNTVLDKMTREQLASSGIDESNPDYINEYQSTREYMRDDQKQAIEDNLNTLYKGRGDDFYTPEFIHKDVWGRNAGVRQTKSDNAQFRPKDDGAGDIYDEAQSVVAQSEENYGSGDAVRSTVSEHYVPAGSKDQTKKIKIALSEKDYSATDDKHVGKAGNVEGTIQGWAAKLYDKKKKTYLKPEEAKVIEKMMAEGKTRQEHDYEWKPVAIFNVIPKKGKTANETTPQETIIMDADKFAGVYKNKTKNANGTDFDGMREKTIQYAEEKNKSIKNKPSAKKSFTKQELKSKAEAAGYTYDEYYELVKDKVNIK